MKIFAKVGGTEQLIDFPECPEGYIEAKSLRPDGDYIMSESGEWVEYTPVPEKITKRQAMLQLNKVGLYQSVLDMTSNADNINLKIEFDCATEFERKAPFILGMAKALNLSDEQVDSLFIEAALL